ncbi:MAG TPA: leucyl aminopeptidase family protein [Sphingomicrobium sp.]|jgi:leucyl aminopeptidase|nr:leucyl aminopeptidase family protein [Sphingomicrobium sp.]
MTDFASLIVPDRGQKARLIHIVDKDSFAPWLRKRPPEDRSLLEAQRFDGQRENAFAILPSGGGFEAVGVVRKAEALSPWCLAELADKLPEGTYRLAEREPEQSALGWLLAQHRFDTYRSKKEDPERGSRVLVTGEPARIEPLVRLAEATALVRDLVNTPAADLGPAEIEQSVSELAKRSGAQLKVTTGKDLEDGFPLIAAVGGGATPGRAPRLIELEWGRSDDPRVAIIGKGVCFDSGGLDLKTASGMRIMKKDMGGAAHALALTQLVIENRLPIRLHLVIPAVENAVSGASYRPGDIVKSHKGLFVEIDNTDAEGRLILADALSRAGEEKPELIVDFATLTGAARVALGPDLPATFTNRDELAADLEAAALTTEDPLWRMPLWDPYDEQLKSDVADLSNTSGNSMAGAVYAALFLRRFVPQEVPWAHLDTWAWRDTAKPGRPKGGEALGLRAVFAMLQARYSDA